MFGSKKRKLEEQIRLKEILSETTEYVEVLESSVSQIENARERIFADLKQAEENTEVLAKHAEINVLAESDLIYSMDDFSKGLEDSRQSYKNLLELLGAQQEATMALVEKNKLYTNASRKLKEVPAELEKSANFYEKQLEKLRNYDSRMGVLALHAAIGAGHMGADGISFVSAVEEIRQIVLEQENAVAALLDEVQSSRTQIEEYEACIQYMINLIKESSMAANGLFKKGQEVKAAVPTPASGEFSENMVLMRDKIVGMRNLDEEILKCAKRNKIQFGDMQEDIHTQQLMLEELKMEMSHMLETV